MDAGSSVDAGMLELGSRVLPSPAGASHVLRETVEAAAVADRLVELAQIPGSESEWLDFIASADAEADAEVAAVIEQVPVSVESDEIAGVNVFHVTPDTVDPIHEDHLFVHVHGGAFILGGGLGGTFEAIAVVLGTGMRAVAIDYRMPPRHPSPAAADDVVAVYKHLLGERPARSMAMGGSSAGAGITMAAVQRMIAEGMDLPAALFVGTPGSDLSGTGDSIRTNQGVDRNLPSWDGFIDACAKLYADGVDLTDPRISPLYGDFESFPPSLVVSGTRDILLSNSVRTHIKLRQAGVIADLLVYEGVAHGDYLSVPGSPEAHHFLDELNQFLTTHLRASEKRSRTTLPEVESQRWS